MSALLDLLGNQDPVTVLERTPVSIAAFLDTLQPRIVTTPEAPGKWSIRDVVQHLADQV